MRFLFVSEGLAGAATFCAHNHLNLTQVSNPIRSNKHKGLMVPSTGALSQVLQIHPFRNRKIFIPVRAEHGFAIRNI
jgi:hypothetical protein